MKFSKFLSEETLIDVHAHLDKVDQILVETDTPVAYQGKVSEPAHLLKTLSELSRIKNIPIAELARITTANAKCFFSM